MNMGMPSRYNLQSGSRAKKDCFKVPLLKVGSGNIVFFSEKRRIREMHRPRFGFCNDPPFHASLGVDVGAEAVAINMPEMVST
jgi:hypothetical protein